MTVDVIQINLLALSLPLSLPPSPHAFCSFVSEVSTYAQTLVGKEGGKKQNPNQNYSLASIYLLPEERKLKGGFLSLNGKQEA